jgi:hypothetical protein
MKQVILLFALSLLFACDAQFDTKLSSSGHGSEESSNALTSKSIHIDTSSTLLSKRFSTPNGYERVQLDSNDFGSYLRDLPLKKNGELVFFFNGRKKTKENVYCAVVDQDIDPVDLQQCADAVMRLRGEYLFKQKKYDQIHFNFVSDSKPRYFKDYANGDYSYRKFRSYMKYVFSYANTSSLKNELVKVEKFEDIKPGDVFIQSGTPYGHAVIVVDVAINGEGQKIFMLAQSYMPAQETQILINPNDSTISPWYLIEDEIIQTPEWQFKRSDLRRFK